jgi:hypothetical protein
MSHQELDGIGTPVAEASEAAATEEGTAIDMSDIDMSFEAMAGDSLEHGELAMALLQLTGGDIFEVVEGDLDPVRVAASAYEREAISSGANESSANEPVTRKNSLRSLGNWSGSRTGSMDNMGTAARVMEAQYRAENRLKKKDAKESAPITGGLAALERSGGNRRRSTSGDSGQSWGSGLVLRFRSQLLRKLISDATPDGRKAELLQSVSRWDHSFSLGTHWVVTDKKDKKEKAEKEKAENNAEEGVEMGKKNVANYNPLPNSYAIHQQVGGGGRETAQAGEESKGAEQVGGTSKPSPNKEPAQKPSAKLVSLDVSSEAPQRENTPSHPTTPHPSKKDAQEDEAGGMEEEEVGGVEEQAEGAAKSVGKEEGKAGEVRVEKEAKGTIAVGRAMSRTLGGKDPRVVAVAAQDVELTSSSSPTSRWLSGQEQAGQVESVVEVKEVQVGHTGGVGQVVQMLRKKAGVQKLFNSGRQGQVREEQHALRQQKHARRKSHDKMELETLRQQAQSEAGGGAEMPPQHNVWERACHAGDGGALAALMVNAMSSHLGTAGGSAGGGALPEDEASLSPRLPLMLSPSARRGERRLSVAKVKAKKLLQQALASLMSDDGEGVDEGAIMEDEEAEEELEEEAEELELEELELEEAEEEEAEEKEAEEEAEEETMVDAAHEAAEAMAAEVLLEQALQGMLPTAEKEEGEEVEEVLGKEEREKEGEEEEGDAEKGGRAEGAGAQGTQGAPAPVDDPAMNDLADEYVDEYDEEDEYVDSEDEYVDSDDSDESGEIDQRGMGMRKRANSDDIDIESEVRVRVNKKKPTTPLDQEEDPCRTWPRQRGRSLSTHGSSSLAPAHMPAHMPTVPTLHSAPVDVYAKKALGLMRRTASQPQMVRGSKGSGGGSKLMNAGSSGSSVWASGAGSSKGGDSLAVKGADAMRMLEEAGVGTVDDDDDDDYDYDDAVDDEKVLDCLDTLNIVIAPSALLLAPPPAPAPAPPVPALSWDTDYLGDQVVLSEEGMLATAGEEGQCVRSAAQLLSGSGLHGVSMKFVSTDGEGESLGDNCMVGMVSAAEAPDEYSDEGGVWDSKAWWGISDEGAVFEGEQGCTRFLPDAANCSHGRVFASGDHIGFAVDMTAGTMHFFRNGTLIDGAEITGFPTDDPLHVVASPFDEGTSVLSESISTVPLPSELSAKLLPVPPTPIVLQVATHGLAGLKAEVSRGPEPVGRERSLSYANPADTEGRDSVSCDPFPNPGDGGMIGGMPYNHPLLRAHTSDGGLTASRESSVDSGGRLSKQSSVGNLSEDDIHADTSITRISLDGDFDTALDNALRQPVSSTVGAAGAAGAADAASRSTAGASKTVSGSGSGSSTRQSRANSSLRRRQSLDMPEPSRSATASAIVDKPSSAGITDGPRSRHRRATICNGGPLSELRAVARSHNRKMRTVFTTVGGHKDEFVHEQNSRQLFKTATLLEVSAYEWLYSEKGRDDPLAAFIAPYSGVVKMNGVVYLRLGELLHPFDSPTVMDIKIGSRTYLESQVSDPKLRADLYQKLVKLDKNAPTEEERSAQKCTKLRYLQQRDRISSTGSLCFRVEGIIGGSRAVQKISFKKVKERAEVLEVLRQFLEPPAHCGGGGAVSGEEEIDGVDGELDGEDSEGGDGVDGLDRRRRVLENVMMYLQRIRDALPQSEFFRSHQLVLV